MSTSSDLVQSDYAYTRLSVHDDEQTDDDDELLLNNELSPSGGLLSNSNSDSDFDSLLIRTVGEFGRYQQLIVWMLCIPACFLSAFSTFDLVFIAYTPHFNCSLPIRNDNINNRLNLIDNRSCSRDPEKCCYTTFNGTDNYTMSCFSYNYDKRYFRESIVTEWNLVCDKELMAKTIISVMNLAALIAVIYSYIQDKWGRKTAFLLNLTVFLIGSSGSVMAWNPISFTVFKFVAGISCMWEIGFVWALEFVGPSKRTLVATILSVVYGLANMSLALIAWLTDTWRLFGLCTSAPFAVLFLFACFVPESPRWLLAEGRLDETARIVERMTRWQKKPVPHLELLERLTELKAHLDDEAARSPQKSISVGDFFKSRNLIYKNLLLTFIGIAGNQLYYAAAYDSENLYPDFYVAYVLQTAVEAPATFLNLLLLNRFGRILPLSLSFLLSGFFCLATWPVSLLTSWPIAIVLLTSMSRFFICAGVAICEQLGGELYPTVGRGVGMSVSYVASALSNLCIQYLIYSSKVWLILPLLIMGALATLAGFGSLFLPETRDKPLPDTVQQAEAQGDVSWRTLRDNLSRFKCFRVFRSSSVINDKEV